MKKLTAFFFFIFIFSCNKNKNHSGLQYLSKFETTFVSQFPKYIKTNENDIIVNENERKNDVCAILYEYSVNEKDVDSLQKYYKKNNLCIYNSSDPCLLIVNSFENYETYTNATEVEINEQMRKNIEQNCNIDKYPIPNFIDYRFASKQRSFRLPPGFLIYVIAASNKTFAKYNLEPNPQMPEKWQNGFSKGIAVDANNKTVIYWSLTW